MWGSSGDAISNGVVANDGFIYVTGGTSSNNNISTPGSFQPIIAGGSNGFLSKFSTINGTRIWGTYYPAPTNSISSNNYSDILITGQTNGTPQNIATAGSHQQNFAGGVADGFLENLVQMAKDIGVHIMGAYE
ncbi:MAG: hypothetical protein IPI22_14895 [Bacteroidetes bacterium]|nr:hypothetical protein [Bacteroidota bacterium]